MNPDYTDNEILETMLMREIQKEINAELVKAIQDPSYKPDLTPVEYSESVTAEQKVASKEYWKAAISRDID